MTIQDCWNSIGVAGDGSCPELARLSHCRNCRVYSAAGSELLTSILSADSIAEHTEYYARPAQRTERLADAAMLFRIGAEWLALGTAWIEQVARPAPVHTLPGRRTRAVLGLTNIDGELVVCASLAEVLGIGGGASIDPKTSPHARVVVLRHEDVRAACPVDEVHGVVRFSHVGLQEPAPAPPGTLQVVSALLPWEKKVAGILDGQRLLRALQHSFA